MSAALGAEGGSQLPGHDGIPVVDYEQVAADYSATQVGLLSYAARNSKHMIHASDTEWRLAAGLPAEEEYGAREGDIGLGLELVVRFDPKSRLNSYELTLHHDRADVESPAEDESAEAESTVYPGVPGKADLDQYREDVAQEWFLLLFVATAGGLFRKNEARFRLPEDHPGRNSRRAAQTYAAAQLSIAAWREAQAAQEPDGKSRAEPEQEEGLS